jgi:hypothetical protein
MNNRFEEEGFQNLFFIILFFIILFLFIRFTYTQLSSLFPTKTIPINLNSIENFKSNDDVDSKEDFINIYSLNDFLYNIEDGEFIEDQQKKEKEVKKKITKKIVHPKNNNIEERKPIEEKPQEEKVIQKVQPKNDHSILYIVDKNKYHYDILNKERNVQYYVNGYKDPYFIHQIVDKDKREISIIKNKIYNKYAFIYKTPKDKDIQLYYIEFRPSQSRFIKIYDEDDKIAFYLEKIEYKNDVENMNYVPLYNIFYYAENMGKIYLNQSKDDNHTTYFIHIQNEKKDYKEILSFGFILYLSLSKDNNENYD